MSRKTPEGKFKARITAELEELFPGCFIMKNDEQLIQGIPDMTILYRNKWAVLEVKESSSSPYEPNQEYYLDIFNQMSYSSVIHPDNKQEVFDDLQRAFESR